MDQRTSMLACVVVAALAGATQSGDAVLSLKVEDAPEQHGFWQASVGDLQQVSLEFRPERDGVSSTGKWSASLEHRLVTPETAARTHTPASPPQWEVLSNSDSWGESSEQYLGTPGNEAVTYTPESQPQAAPLAAATGGDEELRRGSESEVTGFSMSVGRFTLVKLPALDRASADIHCELEGDHVAVVRSPEDLQQLRELLDMHPADKDAELRDAYLDIADGSGRLLKWTAGEIRGSPCLTMTPAGELVLRACDLQLTFFCQHPDQPQETR